MTREGLWIGVGLVWLALDGGVDIQAWISNDQARLDVECGLLMMDLGARKDP